MTTSLRFSEKRVELSDGCRIHVEVRGEGIPILLIHAGSEDSSGWVKQAEAFAHAGFQAFTYDRRGTRHSDRIGWPGEGSPGHARDAANLVDDLGIAPALVLGVSSGAIVALDLCATYPGLAKFGYVHEPPLFRHATDGMEAFEPLRRGVELARAHASDDYGEAYRTFLEITYGPGAVQRLPSWRWEMESSNAEAFVRDDLPLIALRQFSQAELNRLRDRVIVTSGSESSEFLKRAALELAEAIGCRHQVLNGQGHTPHLVDAEPFVRLVLETHRTGESGLRY